MGEACPTWEDEEASCQNHPWVEEACPNDEEEEEASCQSHPCPTWKDEGEVGEACPMGEEVGKEACPTWEDEACSSSSSSSRPWEVEEACRRGRACSSNRP